MNHLVLHCVVKVLSGIVLLGMAVFAGMSGLLLEACWAHRSAVDLQEQGCF